MVCRVNVIKTRYIRDILVIFSTKRRENDALLKYILIELEVLKKALKISKLI